MNQTCCKNRKRAFTLIELVVVIAIIGLLASVVTTSLQASRYKADDARRDIDMREIRTAIELYGQKNNLDYSGLVVSGGESAEECQLFRNIAAKLVQDGHLSDIPRDPRNSAGTCYRAYMNVNHPTYGTIVAAYAYKWQKYNNNVANKKTGFVVSKSGDIMEVAAITCNDGSGTPFSYPIFDPDAGNLCDTSGGTIADKVVGVTEGTD